MKRTKIGLSLLAVILTVLSSCDNAFLPTPFIPGNEINSSRSIDAPDGLTATHGGYRSITVSWNPKSDAVLYYIYRSNSPLETFVRNGETSENKFEFKVTPGATVFYRISSVSQEGEESSISTFVKGTSLAQPVISDITEKTESGAAVTWYMENVSDDTYRNNLLYTVYCFDGPRTVAQLALDGSTLIENKANFSNLNPNTRYEYQVEAYLRSDQNAIEKSVKVDAATARRMRPGAPENLKATRGKATDKIELTFELPDNVDIALGDNQFKQHPVYFVISKRRYSAVGNNEYQKICSYFGINKEKAANELDVIDSYIPGVTVKWTDKTVTRGVEYEYQVQSYVDETQNVISSDSSKASIVGWAMGEGNLDFGKVNYKLFDGLDEYESAKLPLLFDFDPKDVTYSYTLVEKVEPIEDDHPYDPFLDGFDRNITPLTYNEIRNYTASMDLTQQSDIGTPGRGIYSYEVKINLNGETIDTVATIGKVEVSENTQPIIVEGFHVQDGYTDKFVFKWNYRGNRKYIISMSDNRTTWTDIDTVNPNPNNDSTVEDDNYSHTYSTGITPGITKYFAIRPYRDNTSNNDGSSFKAGQMVYATTASKTLGVPVVALSGDASYSNITVAWPETQKADTYRIKYWYTSEGKTTIKTAATVARNDPNLRTDVSERLNYTFSPFVNNAAETAKAGLEIQVEVEALNESLRAEVGGGEIATTSNNTVATKLVGPALLNPQASRAVSRSNIDVSWDKISGANGYYVYRRQFNMNNSAEEGTAAIVYYVPASETSSFAPTGKELALDSVTNEKIDATVVKATAGFANNRYTLTDIYLPDTDYDGGIYARHLPAYRDQQNDIAQGLSYRYYIVPVINRNNAPEPLNRIEFVYAKDSSNKNTNISAYTIQESGKTISYSGAAAFEKEGFTIGFAQNVIATKGTHSSGGNVNDRIQIKWDQYSAKLNGLGFTPSFTVYRRLSDTTTWVTVQGEINGVQFVDNPPENERGRTYEYVVGISNGNTVSQPGESRRFIDKCKSNKDDKGRAHYLGFIQGQVRMNSVSRDARMVGSEFAELVTWRSAGISPYSSTEYNWGIDGYTLFLLNRNVNNGREWIEVTDVPVSGLPNQLNQNFTVANNASNILKVLRDYRHYFKVRSYVLNNGDKVYCTDPAPNYLWTDGAENEFVKWGARQISTNEFAAITALSIGTAMNWAGSETSSVPDRNTGSGSVSFSNQVTLGYSRNIDFSNSKPYFVTIGGRLHGRCVAINQTPAKYGAYGQTLSGLSGSDQDSRLTVNGPDDVNGMYSGGVYIRGMESGAGTGPYKVTYNGQTDVAIEAKHYKENFTFQVGSNGYKRTRNFDWSPSGGIAGTSPDKWWYPLSGDKAGWD